ncbi:putative GH25 family protein [Nitrospirillum pindoramense]|uniref:Putative GH25 family protein n=1 Tax=Nitrospirillum amazonense TaxID=28077 RepID=A0A560H9K6_9PROT|nr:putative GH25 family protein [Nitrospirillum amazonense]
MTMSRRGPRRGLAGLLALWALAWGAGALAHDFWIEPSSFRPGPGTAVAVGLRVGEDFIGDPVPRTASLIDRFFIRQAGEEQAISGADNIDPAGFVRADGRATALIAYTSTGSDLTLPADRFTAYLRQYGLDPIVADRERRGESGLAGRECFYRYAKSLLTGAGPDPAVTRPLGFTYEIVPDTDPTMPGGAPLRGHVLFQGHPVAGAVVTAHLQGEPTARLATRSDARGAFTFPLRRGGVWLVRSVHMVRAGMLARWLHARDWESHWASLTFDWPGPAQPAPGRAS